MCPIKTFNQLYTTSNKDAQISFSTFMYSRIPGEAVAYGTERY